MAECSESEEQTSKPLVLYSASEESISMPLAEMFGISESVTKPLAECLEFPEMSTSPWRNVWDFGKCQRALGGMFEISEYNNKVVNIQADWHECFASLNLQ